MSFNNAADPGYVDHDHRDFDRLYKLHDTLYKELSKNTRELSALKELVESLFREMTDIKSDMKTHNKETRVALKDHEDRITSIEKFLVKLNTAKNVIIAMVTLGGILIGYLHFFG